MDVCAPDLKVVEAAQIMIDDEIGSLAVTRDGRSEGGLVGIFTERDALRAVAKRMRPNDTVESYMTPDPDSLSLDVEVDDAIDWMMAAGYRHLPVVDGQRLMGMLSIKDLMWAKSAPA